MLGTKVEIKNLNSFRAVERAIDYEVKRQGEILEAGDKVIQETRGWDDVRGTTYAQRTKEEAHDYRYFPEPDLPPITNLAELSQNLAGEIPEMPQQKRERFTQEYNLPIADIDILVSQPDSAHYFEQVVSELKDWQSQAQLWQKQAQPQIEIIKAIKLAANYLITEIPRIANILEIKDYVLADKITPENFAEFVKLISQNVVSSSGAQAVLREMFAFGADPSHIIQEKDLAQVSDEEELNKTIAEIVSQNSGAVQDYKKGKQNVLMFLVGKVMAATRGKANPQVAQEILEKELKK